ncbi:MAG: cytochrome ubiquinol oxidase subunit I [Desulfofustis sp. PB-SRB1]|nr:cytochrome ubiquinol oxidase subunit I [Desulfofustis sp. PB-SRB1]
MSVSSFFILKKRHLEFAPPLHERRSDPRLGFLAGLAINGHTQAQNVYRYQPAKLASFEGHLRRGRRILT